MNINRLMLIIGIVIWIVGIGLFSFIKIFTKDADNNMLLNISKLIATILVVGGIIIWVLKKKKKQ